MPQQTYIHFYTTDEVTNISEALSLILRKFGSEDEVEITRTSGPDNEWQARTTNELVGYDFLGKTVSILEAGQYYLPDRLLSIIWFENESGLFRKMSREVYEAIHPDVRLNHLLNDHDLHAGRHDIFGLTSNESEADSYIARASVSISIWGSGIPRNLAEYESEILRLPAARRMIAVLSDVLAVPISTKVTAVF